MEKPSPICRRIAENTAAYLDGELKGGARRLIEEHLADCPECRARLEELKETWRLLDELEEPIVRNNFRRQVLLSAREVRKSEQAARAARVGGRRSILAGLAASAAAAVFLFGLYVSSKPLSDLPTPEQREAITYLDLLQDIDALMTMDEVKQLQELGTVIDPEGVGSKQGGEASGV
ncbi:MAG: hypothetical protein GWP05_04235 [Anaerolineaceae bacterium]|nr:hypothetical protein [Anaerolineaceae bacterium]